ncbi:hypothetical protein BC332_21936 [Capsicum chinense]|nr:hypothetical protein BC332_21936 [Capsicum chinense]
MDNPPSFSLGINQLDATVQDIPLGFVPATFDEQDPDWAENRSKHRNDPVTMKKLVDKAASKSKKSTSKASKKKFDDSADHGMKYRIDKVPPHPLHMESLCNCAFGEEIKEYFEENILGAFRNTIFNIFLDLPRCNWIGQILKCLLMLEIQQDNKDELHVWVQGEILKFTMLEFAIISGLKCTDSIDDYMYTSSSKSALMSRPKYESFMSGMFTKHSYKNIQPITDEVSRLDLSFSKDFVICDPTTYASTFDSRKLKRTAVELQQRVGIIAEEFGDFSTISPQEILMKDGFESPVSPDQPLKKKKTVMFDQEKQVVMDGDTSGYGHAAHHGFDFYRETHKDATDKGEISVSEIQHHHHVEIGISPQSNQHKSIPSSSTQPEETSKLCLDEKMAKLVTLISKIPAEVVKALKMEQNKQSREDKIDEQQHSQEDGSNKQERQHKSDMQHEDYDKGSLNDMEVSRDEESNKQHLLEEQQLLDVNAADKDAGHEDNFENEDCSDLQALEDEIMAYEEEYIDEELGKKNISDVEDLPDVILTAKEDVIEVNLKNQKSTDMTDVQDEVGGIITDLIQSAVDTILVGLSTPSTTKSLDVGASNKMIERHWDHPDSHIPPDFSDAQVRELQASKSKAPAKQERKKSRVLRSPYISKYGSGSKDAVDIDKKEKLKYAFDGKQTKPKPPTNNRNPKPNADRAPVSSGDGENGGGACSPVVTGAETVYGDGVSPVAALARFCWLRTVGRRSMVGLSTVGEESEISTAEVGSAEARQWRRWSGWIGEREC